jgi:autophagy-related protein 9
MTVRGTSRGPAGRHAPTRRTPRAGPSSGPSDTLNSTLLDPHHQPAASALRGSPRQGSNGRYKSSLQPVDQSTRIEEESTLGDSWRTSRLAQNDDDEEEEASGGNQGGVLQLLRQFSKAQAEGRGAGVGV